MYSSRVKVWSVSSSSKLTFASPFDATGEESGDYISAESFESNALAERLMAFADTCDDTEPTTLRSADMADALTKVDDGVYAVSSVHVEALKLRAI
jgi:hypothetical protein